MRRWWMWLVGVVTLLAVASVVVSFFIDEPLRRHIEQQINAQLQGYTVRIGALDFHPFSLSVDLKDVVIVQDGHPDPPVLCVPELSASVQWRALLAGRLVSDMRIERPRVHLNLMQVRHEARDEAPVQERGWQEALQAVYPLRINELWVVDGEFTYIDTQLVGDDIVVRFVGLGGLCSTETAKGTGEDVVGVVGATDGPQMGHSVRSPRKRGTSSRHVHAVLLGVGALIGDEINVLSHQAAIGFDARLDMVRHNVTAVIAEAFLNLLGERWGLCRHSSNEMPFIAHLL